MPNSSWYITACNIVNSIKINECVPLFRMIFLLIALKDITIFFKAIKRNILNNYLICHTRH